MLLLVSRRASSTPSWDGLRFLVRTLGRVFHVWHVVWLGDEARAVTVRVAVREGRLLFQRIFYVLKIKNSHDMQKHL